MICRRDFTTPLSNDDVIKVIYDAIVKDSTKSPIRDCSRSDCDQSKKVVDYKISSSCYDSVFVTSSCFASTEEDNAMTSEDDNKLRFDLHKNNQCADEDLCLFVSQNAENQSYEKKMPCDKLTSFDDKISFNSENDIDAGSADSGSYDDDDTSYSDSSENIELDLADVIDSCSLLDGEIVNTGLFRSDDEEDECNGADEYNNASRKISESDFTSDSDDDDFPLTTSFCRILTPKDLPAHATARKSSSKNTSSNNEVIKKSYDRPISAESLLQDAEVMLDLYKQLCENNRDKAATKICTNEGNSHLTERERGPNQAMSESSQHKDELPILDDKLSRKPKLIKDTKEVKSSSDEKESNSTKTSNNTATSSSNSSHFVKRSSTRSSFARYVDKSTRGLRKRFSFRKNSCSDAPGSKDRKVPSELQAPPSKHEDKVIGNSSAFPEKSKASKSEVLLPNPKTDLPRLRAIMSKPSSTEQRKHVINTPIEQEKLRTAYESDDTVLESVKDSEKSKRKHALLDDDLDMSNAETLKDQLNIKGKVALETRKQQCAGEDDRVQIQPRHVAEESQSKLTTLLNEPNFKGFLSTNDVTIPMTESYTEKHRAERSHEPKSHTDRLNEPKQHADCLNDLQKHPDRLNESYQHPDCLNKPKQHPDCLNEPYQYHDCLNDHQNQRDRLNEPKQHPDGLKHSHQYLNCLNEPQQHPDHLNESKQHSGRSIEPRQLQDCLKEPKQHTDFSNERHLTRASSRSSPSPNQLDEEIKDNARDTGFESEASSDICSVTSKTKQEKMETLHAFEAEPSNGTRLRKNTRYSDVIDQSSSLSKLSESKTPESVSDSKVISPVKHPNQKEESAIGPQSKYDVIKGDSWNKPEKSSKEEKRPVSSNSVIDAYDDELLAKLLTTPNKPLHWKKNSSTLQRKKVTKATRSSILERSSSPVTVTANKKSKEAESVQITNFERRGRPSFRKSSDQVVSAENKSESFYHSSKKNPPQPDQTQNFFQHAVFPRPSLRNPTPQPSPYNTLPPRLPNPFYNAPFPRQPSPFPPQNVVPPMRFPQMFPPHERMSRPPLDNPYFLPARFQSPSYYNPNMATPFPPEFARPSLRQRFSPVEPFHQASNYFPQPDVENPGSMRNWLEEIDESCNRLISECDDLDANIDAFELDDYNDIIERSAYDERNRNYHNSRDLDRQERSPSFSSYDEPRLSRNRLSSHGKRHSFNVDEDREAFAQFTADFSRQLRDPRLCLREQNFRCQVMSEMQCLAPLVQWPDLLRFYDNIMDNYHHISSMYMTAEEKDLESRRVLESMVDDVLSMHDREVSFFFFIFILLSRESNGGAMRRTNPDTLRSYLCFRVFRLNFASDCVCDVEPALISVNSSAFAQINPQEGKTIKFVSKLRQQFP